MIFILNRTKTRRRSQNFLLVVLFVFFGYSKTEAFTHAALGSTAPKVAPTKVFHVGRMYSPVVAFAVRTAARLHEAVVEREIVTNGVAPTGAARMKIRVVVQNPLVNVAQHELFLGCT